MLWCVTVLRSSAVTIGTRHWVTINHVIGTSILGVIQCTSPDWNKFIAIYLALSTYFTWRMFSLLMSIQQRTFTYSGPQNKVSFGQNHLSRFCIYFVLTFDIYTGRIN